MLLHRQSEVYLRNRIRVNNQRQLNAEWHMDTDNEEEDGESSGLTDEREEEALDWPVGLKELQTEERVQIYFCKLARAVTQANGMQQLLREEQVATLEFKRVASRLKVFIDEYRDGSLFITLVKGLRQQNQGHPAVRDVVQALQVQHDNYVGRLGEVLDFCTDRASEMYYAGQFVRTIDPRLPDSHEEVECANTTDESSHGGTERRPLLPHDDGGGQEREGNDSYYMEFHKEPGAEETAPPNSGFRTSSPILSLSLIHI